MVKNNPPLNMQVSKYCINFGFLMAFAIFDINEYFLYNHVEKSRLLFFNIILSNKHAVPSIFNFLKKQASCGIRFKPVPLKVAVLVPQPARLYIRAKFSLRVFQTLMYLDMNNRVCTGLQKFPSLEREGFKDFRRTCLICLLLSAID